MQTYKSKKRNIIFTNDLTLVQQSLLDTDAVFCSWWY